MPLENPSQKYEMLNIESLSLRIYSEEDYNICRKIPSEWWILRFIKLAPSKLVFVPAIFVAMININHYIVISRLPIHPVKLGGMLNIFVFSEAIVP